MVALLEKRFVEVEVLVVTTPFLSTVSADTEDVANVLADDVAI